MSVRKFEDLIAWQKARELTRLVYAVTGKGNFARDFGLRDQIRRASISVMSNIAEGFDRSNRREFHQFLVYAKGSCAEVRNQLYVAMDVGYLERQEFEQLHGMAAETSRIINGLRRNERRQCLNTKHSAHSTLG